MKLSQEGRNVHVSKQQQRERGSGLRMVTSTTCLIPSPSKFPLEGLRKYKNGSEEVGPASTEENQCVSQLSVTVTK